MPRNKYEMLREEAKTTPLLSREVFKTLDTEALALQRIVRDRLLTQMVGTLYPGIIMDEICEINTLLSKARYDEL